MPDNSYLKETEKAIRGLWEKEKIYKFDLNSKKKIYSIDTPPPTVSGRMHIGHAFSYSQQDFIARYKRMKGFNVFYPFGTDDNGLPTEKLVQKEKNVNLRKVSRNEAIKICLDFLKDERPKFIQDWKNIGMSCDFEIFYSTIDDVSRKISQKSFLDLAKKGLVYRKDAPILWDVVFQTAIAQAEMVDKEMKSYFNDFAFKVDGKEIIVATTRPELLGACVAVFANPNDKRHKSIVGKKAITPIYNAEVPIIADEKVEMEKGTGIVMCCTFGDATDVEWYKKYNLPLKMLINPNGTMNELSGKYGGMKIADARKEIINDLREKGLLKSQTEIIHVVQVGERSGEPVEIINSMQWYVKYLDKKKIFLNASEKLNWHPNHMKNKLDNWIKALGWDWSISRQRHFGIPIPVWYCKECGEIIFADEKKLPVDPFTSNPQKPCGKCKSKEFIPEKDVFDTWFTSASSPFLAINLMPKKTREKLFPMSLRPQAHDIINFWLFYTMAKTQLLEGKNPWSDIAISGWALDSKGEKMSKSKGNVIEPQKIMENYGADAIRYWASSSKFGEDISYQEKEILAGKKLANKILNASNFVFLNLKNYKPKKTKLLETDRLFLVKLNELIEKATGCFDNYEYHLAKIETDEFFWHVFCANYLELVKKRVYNGTQEEKDSAFFTLYRSLLTLIKLFAPIVPFVTEDVYQKHFRKNEKSKSVHISEWPETIDVKKKKTDDEVFEILIGVIEKIRQGKSNSKKAMNSEIVLMIERKDKDKLKDLLDDLKSVANAREIKEGKFNVKFV